MCNRNNHKERNSDRIGAASLDEAPRTHTHTHKRSLVCSVLAGGAKEGRRDAESRKKGSHRVSSRDND